MKKYLEGDWVGLGGGCSCVLWQLGGDAPVSYGDWVGGGDEAPASAQKSLKVQKSIQVPEKLQMSVSHLHAHIPV